MDELSNKLLLLTRNKWWPATLASLLVARYSRETVGGLSLRAGWRALARQQSLVQFVDPESDTDNVGLFSARPVAVRGGHKGVIG